MTIAMCCLTPEGVVLGADSTTSVMVPQGGFHYLNFNQKLFQIGETGTLGALTWGLAALGNLSHRTQFALLADELAAKPAGSVMEVAERWTDRFWHEYSTRLSNEIQRCRDLHTKSKYDASTPPTPAMRTEKEERDYIQLKLGLPVGFCIAGYYTTDRWPQAFEILFDPLAAAPTPKPLPMGQAMCWGVPKIFGRLVSGIDTDLKAEILKSEKWSGSEGT